MKPSLLFIGHSYHEKTRSSEFIISLLSETYDIKILYDESWSGGVFPDVLALQRDYDVIVFWQTILDRSKLKKLRHENIVFFPMFDAVHDWGIEAWRPYRRVKIICFSSTLYKRLSQWGFNLLYVKFFPSVGEFCPGSKKEVFFWQRINTININTIVKLVGDNCVDIHLHKVLDYKNDFIDADQSDIKKHNITYSQWFKNKMDMTNLIKNKGIYIAPRLYEGIGLSFLEAMAMGKAVVAVNNPTMNEYIEHEKTGYLYDINNLYSLDLKNINNVQQSTYFYMQKGFEQWNKNKYSIVDFINKSLNSNRRVLKIIERLLHVN